MQNNTTGNGLSAVSEFEAFTGFKDLQLKATIWTQLNKAWAHDRQSGDAVYPITQGVLKETNPEDAMEGMLVAQMAACHSHCMTMFAKADNASMDDHQIEHLKMAERLMRAYASALETIDKRRRGGKQSMRVEHVHVGSGGQAIIGQVAGGGSGNDG